MATRYWVGGSGNWDATTTTNWSASSGGAGGASAPTSVDNVIFDSSSNSTLYTVTVGTNAACADLTAAGPLVGNVTFSLAATAVINCFGSMTLAATGITWTTTSGAVLAFLATTTGKTITTNGVALGALNIQLVGVGGGWTLGSALSAVGLSLFSCGAGSFNTANFNLTVNSFVSSSGNIRSVTLGSSTLTLAAQAALTFTSTNLTFDAGTSQITCSNVTLTFAGGGLTFYNLSIAAATGTLATITGANTFNNLSIGSPAANGYRSLSLGANQTVSGVLTLGTTNAPTRRVFLRSDTLGTQRTVTLNGSLATLADVDFRDIATAGTVGTWTGTRLGNALNNSGITLDVAKNVYWNLAAGGTWGATAWALASGGGVNVNNFPLPQDTAIIENTGLNTSATITIDVTYNIGAITTSTRSNAMTLANTTISPTFYSNMTLSSSVTLTGTGTFGFVGVNSTQTITSAGRTFTQAISILNAGGTVTLADNLTTNGNFTLTQGTLNLNNNVLTALIFFSSNITSTRSIAFGTGNITITGNNATIWAVNNVTNFSYTGTPTVNCTYSGAVGTRTFNNGGSVGGNESTAISFNISAGSDTITFATSATNSIKNLNFTGFSGTLSNTVRTIYGNLTLSSGMTIPAGTVETIFGATSGTQLITTNNKTLDFPLTFNGIGGTFAFQDALTQGSTRPFTIFNGTVQLKSSATTTVGAFATSGTNQKFLQSTTPGTQATLTQASGTVNAAYLTIRDINATGGATWLAYTDQGNTDAGNVDGWDFGISPVVGGAEYTYTLRSFTQPRRF